MNPRVERSLFNDRRLGYAITDRALTLIELSDTLHDIYPGEQPPQLGQSLFELTPEFIGNEDMLADILTGTTPRFQLALVNREIAGQVVYFTLIALPYHDESGNIVGVLHLIQDVTEIGILNQELTQQRNELHLLQGELILNYGELAAANAELQQLAEMKTKFVSVAAHELRTPLAAITGYVEILLDGDYGPLADKQRRSLEIVERGAQRLLTITNDLLDVARLETGRLELILQPINLAKLLKNVAIEFEAMLNHKNQQLTIQASSTDPFALCDETRTTQIIGNLLSNASKYTPEGGHISLNLTLAKTEGFLQVSITDNGIGILPEDHARLFSRFFRAESAHKTKSTGAGLGLHIARSLVELHGGEIWFESEPDQGTTFYVTLPRADEMVDLTLE